MSYVYIFFHCHQVSLFSLFIAPFNHFLFFSSFYKVLDSKGGRFFKKYKHDTDMKFPYLFMILVKILEILFPPTSEMQYSISDLSIVASVGDVQVQGPHMDSFSGSEKQNMSFLYSLTDPTSLIFWDNNGNNTLYPTRVHVPSGSVILFGGNTIHSGSDYNNSAPHYRLHGYIDNVHVSHNTRNHPFKAIDPSIFNILYNNPQP